MTIELGAVPITGFISPSDSEDSYATHKDVYGKGGYRTVTDLDALNLISEDRRVEGMLVYVLSNNKMYQLLGGIENDNWEISTVVPPLPQDYIFKGNDLGEAEASQALIDVNLDINNINSRLDQMADATVVLSVANPQFLNAEVLADKPNGFLFHIGGLLTTLNPLDLVHLPSLTHNNVWVGNNLNKATESLYELNNIPNNGNIDINNYEIINATNPTIPSSLANKSYIDNAIANITSYINDSLTAFSHSSSCGFSNNLASIQTLSANVWVKVTTIGLTYYGIDNSTYLNANNTEFGRIAKINTVGNNGYMGFASITFRSSTAGTNTINLQIVKNGVINSLRPINFATRIISASSDQTLNLQTPNFEMDVGDYVEVFVMSTQNTNLTIRELTFTIKTI